MTLGTVLVVAVLLAWLVQGQPIVGLVDRVTTEPIPAPPLGTIMIDQGGDRTIAFGDRSIAQGEDWRVVERPAKHVTLETAHGAIVLGSVVRCWTSGKDAYTFVIAPDAGDTVTLTRRRSRIPWPRPFVINWLGRRSARWGRYVYHRLAWRKANGTTLDATWRDVQLLQPGSGWMDEYLSRPPTKSRLLRK